jgi:hypothetical protein
MPTASSSTLDKLFQLATVYAALAAPLDPTATPAGEDAGAASERGKHTGLALKSLKEAIDKGWANPAALKDRVFDPFRSHRDFQELVRIVNSVAEANQLLASQAARVSALAYSPAVAAPNPAAFRLVSVSQRWRSTAAVPPAIWLCAAFPAPPATPRTSSSQTTIVAAEPPGGSGACGVCSGVSLVTRNLVRHFISATLAASACLA